MHELRDEIVELEARIEELSGRIENCRKIGLLARCAIGTGAVLVLTALIGIVYPDPLLLMVGIAAMIGGVVLLGSNRSTADAASSDLRTAEGRRSELIGRIDLQVVRASCEEKGAGRL